jgi:hypothetical protein
VPTDTARWCGWLLIAGLVVFFVGAALWRPAEFQAPVLGDALRNVAKRRGIWLWIHVWMAGGVVLTIAGLSVWTEIQRQSGDALATPIGQQLFLVGGVLWLLAMALRLTVQDFAATEALKGRVPEIYPSIHRLAGVLHAVHMVLSYLSAAALGAGILRSGVLSPAMGWTGLIGGGAFAIGFVALGGGPFAMPFLAHVYTFTIGVLLLRAH